MEGGQRPHEAPEARVAASAILDEESLDGFTTSGGEEDHRLVDAVEDGFAVLTLASPKLRLRVNGPAVDGIAFATIEIQPAALPPDKALTVGSNAGNVRVTMESSTDLVNWTPAVNGAVYTNSPDARFFRIKVDK